MSVLTADGITYAYARGTAVLSDVSLDVESHERVAISAPSGRGKSTLCQLLAGYLSPQAGRVTLDGAPVVHARGAACPVQLVWQHPEQALDPYLRIRTSLGEAGEPDGQLVAALGIRPEWLGRFPHELSGGQLQRCCIARALAASPRFLIADEISTMLDAITQAELWNFLLSYCAERDVGLVLVTHSPALQTRLATRVVELA